jgi:hypothetical protein
MRTLLALVVWSLQLGTGMYPPITTPGVVNPRITQDNLPLTVCLVGWTDTIQPSVKYMEDLKKTQMHTLGYVIPDLGATCMYASSNPACYQEDHRIPIEVGGHPTDPANLWPQRLTGIFNANDKDELEFAVHAALCRGDLLLSHAQSVFQGDWTSEFAEYVAVRKMRQPKVE